MNIRTSYIPCPTTVEWTTDVITFFQVCVCVYLELSIYRVAGGLRVGGRLELGEINLIINCGQVVFSGEKINRALSMSES